MGGLFRGVEDEKKKDERPIRKNNNRRKKDKNRCKSNANSRTQKERENDRFLDQSLDLSCIFGVKPLVSF